MLLLKPCGYIWKVQQGHCMGKTEGRLGATWEGFHYLPDEQDPSVRAGGLSAFTPDSFGQLHVLGHDGYSLGVNGDKICVLKNTHYVSLCSFLESKECS